MKPDKKTRREVSFVTGSLPKSMLRFVGPFLLSILVQNLYGAVDLYVVGQFAETADVSAVTIGSQLMNIVTQLIIGFATGITVVIGRNRGAGDEEGLSRATGAVIFLFSIAAVLLSAVYIIGYRGMVFAMQTPVEAVAQTRAYLLVCAFGIVFIVGYNVITGILTGLGDSKTPFIFICIACVINIVLDFVLVKYVHMGALGAAVATTIAQAGSFVFSLVFLRRKGLGYPLGRRFVRFDKTEILRISKIGAPVAIQNALVSASFLLITAIINQMGLIASAAVGVVEKLITFLFVPAVSLGTAVSTASSQNLGAMQYERAKKALWWAILMAIIPAILITIFCQYKGALLTGIISKDPAVIALAADYLRSYIFDILLVSFVFCMNGFFNSCGKSWFSLLHSLLSTLGGRVPLAILFSRLTDTGLYLIGWAAPLSTLASLIMCFIFLAVAKPGKEFSVKPA